MVQQVSVEAGRFVSILHVTLLGGLLTSQPYLRDRRRRAGIPDEDSRPFDVAHAAAALKRRQEAEEMMRAEKARVEALHQARDSEWAQLGRQMTGSQGHVRGKRSEYRFLYEN